MNICCEGCHQTGKGSYTTFFLENKMVTLCHDCRYGKGVPRNTKTENQIFNELQTPFWKLMGQQPKPKDIAYEKYLKSKNMTYGDGVRERNLHGTEKGVYDAFTKASKNS